MTAAFAAIARARRDLDAAWRVLPAMLAVGFPLLTLEGVWPGKEWQVETLVVGLARIVLADLPADHRASIALCLEHGYSYAQAGETLGLPRETVRAHLYEARKMFKQLQDASAQLSPASAERAQ